MPLLQNDLLSARYRVASMLGFDGHDPSRCWLLRFLNEILPPPNINWTTDPVHSWAHWCWVPTKPAKVPSSPRSIFERRETQTALPPAYLLPYTDETSKSSVIPRSIFERRETQTALPPAYLLPYTDETSKSSVIPRSIFERRETQTALPPAYLLPCTDETSKSSVIPRSIFERRETQTALPPAYRLLEWFSVRAWLTQTLSSTSEYWRSMLRSLIQHFPSVFPMVLSWVGVRCPSTSLTPPLP